jgi:hypothetical protein
VYRANGEGRLECREEDVAALVIAGCLLPTEPWTRTTAQKPAPAPEPPKQERKVRLHGRPHMAYQPASGVLYKAGAAGLFQAAEEHVKALERAGCCVVI